MHGLKLKFIVVQDKCNKIYPLILLLNINEISLTYVSIPNIKNELFAFMN